MPSGTPQYFTESERKAGQLAAVRRYQKRNRPAVLATRRRHYYANRERYTENHRNYVRRNPEIVADSNARRYGHPTRLSRGLVKLRFVQQCGVCPTCGVDLNLTGYHKDHILALANGGLHVDRNIWLLCPPCNQSKGDKYLAAWLVERR